MSDLIHIPFHGGEVLIADEDDKPWVVLKPAFEHIGLQADSQIARVQEQPWATTRVTRVVAADGKTRQMVTADLRTFLMALAVIPVKRVKESARELLSAYQSEVADVIEAHWTRDHTPEMDPFAPVTWTWDEARVIIRQRYGVNAPVVHLRRTLRTAGVLRQTGEPKTRYEHWFWFTGTAWEILPHYVPALLRKYEDTIRALRGHQQGRLNLAGDELPFDGADVIELRQGGA